MEITSRPTPNGCLDGVSVIDVGGLQQLKPTDDSQNILENVASHERVCPTGPPTERPRHHGNRRYVKKFQVKDVTCGQLSFICGDAIAKGHVSLKRTNSTQ